jgi:repressor LexA
VNYNLNRLVEAGYIAREEKVARGLRLVAHVPGTRRKKKSDKKAVRLKPDNSRVPLIGHIVASQPVEVPEDIGHHYDEDDMLDVTPAMLGGADPEEVFALRVKGDSMIDAMISENDIVILRHQVTANNGDMVAVWLPERGETTLKYFHQEGDQVRLQPAHPTMDPIYVDAASCEIRGKVLSVMRRLH